MKNSGLCNFLGCCVIAVAILASGIIIAHNLPDTTEVPNRFGVSVDGEKAAFGDFLSESEAAAYLGLTNEDITQLLESGELDSAVYKVGENYIISRQALQEWAESKITW